MEMHVGGADLIPLRASRFVEMASLYEGDELLTNFEVNPFRTALYFVRWASFGGLCQASVIEVQ